MALFARVLLLVPVAAGLCTAAWVPATSPAALETGQCGDVDPLGADLGSLVPGVELLQQDMRAFSRAQSAQSRHGADLDVGLDIAVLAEELAQVSMASEQTPSESTTPPAVIPGFFRPATTTLPPTGVTMNSAGDFDAFISAILTNSITCVVFLAIFMLLRVHYPRKYSGNVLEGRAPSSPDVAKYFSWLQASTSVTQQQLVESVGLDNAMLLEFSSFCMRVCMSVGIPMILVTGLANYALGGHAAGEDKLSYTSFGNVAKGSHLYWLHAAAIWGAVFVVNYMVHREMGNFIKLRWTWLRGMAESRANTVLVEGIPDEWQSASRLRHFFETMFPGDKIEATYCVRDTSALLPLVQRLQEAQQGLHEAQITKKMNPAEAVVVRTSMLASPINAEEHYEQAIKELQPQVQAMRKTIVDASETVGADGFHCSTGFVTFRCRSDAEVALRLTNISSDKMEWIIDTPPDAGDVRWADLVQDPRAQTTRTVLGYAMVVGLYFAYMPLVVGITNIARIIDMGPLQPVWAGIAPTFGLTIMVSFLPTFLINIFKVFFTLKAEAWSQAKLQRWYFVFQVVFVVMATAVGQNVPGFTKAIAEEPFSIFSTLADTMPFATHFYMNYMVLQWVAHCTNMMRYTNLSKYKIFCALYDEEEAAKKSEPEDQEYYGLGSRSARWTTNMVICLVFGTLCPIMYILTFINFAVCRLCYGYLIPFAETRKSDLGGAPFVTQLRHIMQGMMVYTILMTGVLAHRAPNNGPWIAVAPTTVFLWLSLARFDTHYGWERLPFHELMSDEGKAFHAAVPKRTMVESYEQPELELGETQQ